MVATMVTVVLNKRMKTWETRTSHQLVSHFDIENKPPDYHTENMQRMI